MIRIAPFITILLTGAIGCATSDDLEGGPSLGLPIYASSTAVVRRQRSYNVKVKRAACGRKGSEPRVI